MKACIEAEIKKECVHCTEFTVFLQNTKIETPWIEFSNKKIKKEQIIAFFDRLQCEMM